MEYGKFIFVYKNFLMVLTNSGGSVNFVVEFGVLGDAWLVDRKLF